MSISNTQTGTQAGGGVAGVAAGYGLVVDRSISDPSSVAGPFLVGEVVDGVGELIAVVAVVDDGAAADGLLAGLIPAAAGEMGGVGRPGAPVGSGSEIAARFSMPVTTGAFGVDGRTRVVFVAVTDRRAASGGVGRGAPDPHAGTGVDRTATEGSGRGGLEKLVNVALEVSVELGRTRVTLAEVLGYDVGSTIELDRAAGSPVDIRVNDTLLARGEVVLIDDQYAVRITEILDPNQRPS